MQQIYRVLRTYIAMLPSMKLFWKIIMLACSLLVGFVPAVALVWLWWYVKSHCVQLAYRLLL